MSRPIAVLTRRVMFWMAALAVVAASCTGTATIGEGELANRVDASVETDVVAGESPSGETPTEVPTEIPTEVQVFEPKPPKGTTPDTPAITDEPSEEAPVEEAPFEEAPFEEAMPDMEEVEPAPEPEAETVVVSGESVASVLTNRGRLAPMFATGTGGDCPGNEIDWVLGFELLVISSSTDDIVALNTLVLGEPIVLALETMPRETAWQDLSNELATTDALAALSPADLHSGMRLIIVWDNPQEETLNQLVEQLRALPSTLVITDNRCIESDFAVLIDG